ncbi:hypothetical protein ACIQW9_00995 [Herminiimonas sp. NPDC097707]|uniref:hypothetical protein n=1 Tax=Herminiimonas sp. NPDC097707 TaxID=3364007 RepID=UPI00383AABA7
MELLLIVGMALRKDAASVRRKPSARVEFFAARTHGLCKIAALSGHKNRLRQERWPGNGCCYFRHKYFHCASQQIYLDMRRKEHKILNAASHQLRLCPVLSCIIRLGENPCLPFQNNFQLPPKISLKRNSPS